MARLSLDPHEIREYITRDMRFVADCMLGKLARWLRILSYDTAYDPFAEDDDLLEQALSGGRILLTRDTPLADRAPDGSCVLVEHGHLDDQIAQLVRTVGLDLDRETFTRCLICNVPIKDVSGQEIGDRVPPYILERHSRFHECPSCERVYWRGTHLDRMAERLEAIRAKTTGLQGVP